MLLLPLINSNIMKKLFTLALTILSFNSFAQIPNADLDPWTNYNANGTSLSRPDDWFGSDAAICWADTGFFGFILNPEKQVFPSGTFHSGPASARLESLPVVDFLGNATYFTAAISTSPFVYAGLAVLPSGPGIPVTERIPFVYAWARYTSESNDDTASMVVTAYIPGSNGDSVIGTGTTDILPMGSYAQIGTVIQYTDANVVPTSINITFYSSKNMIGGTDTSRLWVDDISWSTTSVKALTESNVVKCFPNPSSGIVSVYNTLNEAVTMKVFNLNGQQVAEKKFKDNDVIDLTAQANGIYFFTILNSNGQAVQKGKLVVAK
jgi:hypothetical protein